MFLIVNSELLAYHIEKATRNNICSWMVWMKMSCFLPLLLGFLIKQYWLNYPHVDGAKWNANGVCVRESARLFWVAAAGQCTNSHGRMYPCWQQFSNQIRVMSDVTSRMFIQSHVSVVMWGYITWLQKEITDDWFVKITRKQIYTVIKSARDC